MNPSTALPEQLRRYACVKLNEFMSQISRCAALLTLEQAWHRPNERSNAVGNLLLHLRGNLSQWIVDGLEGCSAVRDRPAEFAQRTPLPVEPMVEALGNTVRLACERISRLGDAEFSNELTIQGYRTTVVAAVFHVVEHFAFHTGQIIWATKALRDVDLSLYDSRGKRLDGRNDGIP